MTGFRLPHPHAARCANAKSSMVEQAMTYTYAILPVSKEAFDEIAAALRKAGYEHALTEDGLDMHGLALAAKDGENPREKFAWMKHEFMVDCDLIAKAAPHVGRELAVAKTNMQTAMLWAHDAIEKATAPDFQVVGDHAATGVAGQ